MLAPVLPEIGQRTGTGPGVAGLLVASFGLGQLVGYPIAGILGQRRGASWVLRVSLVLLLVGDAAFVAGSGLAAWFPARAVQGVGAAGLWIGVSFAILELWPDQAYQRVSGALAAYSAGAIAGPAMGAVHGIRAPFVLHAVVTLVAFVPVLALGAAETRARIGADRSVLRTRAFALSAAGIVLIALTIGTLDGPLPLHFADRLDQAQIAGLYVLTSVVVAGGAIWAGKLKPVSALVAGAILIPIGVAVVGATDAVSAWIPSLAVAGVGFGLGEVGALGILLAAVPRERIVTAWVTSAQLWAAGYLVGPALAGLFAAAFGYAVLGAVPLVGSLLVAYTLRARVTA